MYSLLWKGEIIESDIETYEEAQELRDEYTMAYSGTVTIIKG